MTDFERGRIVEHQKQAVSQSAVAVPVERRKTAVANFLKQPELNGTRIPSG